MGSTQECMRNCNQKDCTFFTLAKKVPEPGMEQQPTQHACALYQDVQCLPQLGRDYDAAFCKPAVDTNKDSRCYNFVPIYRQNGGYALADPLCKKQPKDVFIGKTFCPI